MAIQSDWFSYDKQKVIQALRYHFISRREIKILLIVINVFAVLSAVLFYMKKVNPLAFLLSSALWFIMMLSFWYILPWMIYRKARTFKDTFKLSADEQHLMLENKDGSKTWAWKDFQSWTESPHFYHLYFNPRSFFIFPKDAFTDEDVHALRKLLRAHIA
jgi:uncharacterized membrane protein